MAAVVQELITDGAQETDNFLVLRVKFTTVSSERIF